MERNLQLLDDFDLAGNWSKKSNTTDSDNRRRRNPRMSTKAGRLVYNIYRALTYSVSPFLYLRLRWRKFRGLEHPDRWSERLGRPSLPRPPGPLLWFHAVSLGEGMAAFTMIKYCIKRRPEIGILMTTTNSAAFEVIKTKLPSSVIYQVAPYDAPSTMDAFLRYWKPSVILLLESELWPNLVLCASSCGISLALLNARISEKSLRRWSLPFFLPLISLMLSKFSLIIPLGTSQAIRFQLLNAPPFIINFSGDLKHNIDECGTYKNTVKDIDQLQVQLAGRKVWIASSIHRGEEKVIIEVHKKLMLVYPEVLTIIVPRYPFDGLEMVKECLKEGLNPALRSCGDRILMSTSVFVVDTLGELQELYGLAPIAVIGGSFLPGLAGHNISEAATASCAVLTGYHVGHFSHMIAHMQQLDPLSVKQVSGRSELEEEVIHLFSDREALEARRVAGKLALEALSSGVAKRIWNQLEFHVFRQALHQNVSSKMDDSQSKSNRL